MFFCAFVFCGCFCVCFVGEGVVGIILSCVVCVLFYFIFNVCSFVCFLQGVPKSLGVPVSPRRLPTMAMAMAMAW